MVAAPEEIHAGPEAPSTEEATPGPLVLVVDDEAPMQGMLRIVLRGQGLRTVEATSGAEALTVAAAQNPDLVVLDLGLPDSDGFEVTRHLRGWMTSPILVISARGDVRDKIALLDAGANDYVTKPFAAGELLARIRVLLRRDERATSGRDDSVIEAGNLRIDLGRRLVFVGEREVHLTLTEYTLFATLMRSKNCVLTHEDLLEKTWGPLCREERQYLRVYMGHLRQKLERDPARPQYLVTETGIGYRLRVPP